MGAAAGALFSLSPFNSQARRVAQLGAPLVRHHSHSPWREEEGWAGGWVEGEGGGSVCARGEGKF